MKTNPHPTLPGAFACSGTTVARLIASLALTSTLLVALSAHGITVMSKAGNAEVRLGAPYLGETELENPLAGNEIVADRHVLEWRDADYAALPVPWFDDWSVNSPAGITGWDDQIWLSNMGDSAWTTTTVPSTAVSIHLNGDNNDGIAEVMVDGVQVALLDMFYGGGPGGQWRETVLVVVKGLANTTHTIQVNDLGLGVGGDDVALNGAAALKENPVKWDQPPVPADATNIFYGWNEPSLGAPYLATFAADDWVCTSSNPVTKIRWWGSFAGWMSNAPPPTAPVAFQMVMWTDVPANTDAPYSHPGVIQWTNTCTSFTWKFAGYDYDPRNGTYESCFVFEQTLLPHEYFTQTNPPGTIHWVSILALGQTGQWNWGWKTRPRDPTSPAPDAAVRTAVAATPPWQPIYWPGTNAWDLAFELISEVTSRDVKWEQVPDLSPNGMDVDATWNPQWPGPAYLLADDFLCTSTGPITNITIWGSWTNDIDWQSLTFTLSIHDDIPTNISPTGYSMPGALRWLRPFGPGQFVQSIEAAPIDEWWFTPPITAVFPGDHICYRYDFSIPPLEAFVQEGTELNPVVYWLDVQVQVMGAEPFVRFGWKTCPTNWNDDAVWVMAQEPYNGIWNRMVYPPQHPRQGTVDLAFRLNAGQITTSELKWSQPPVATNAPGLFNGWNEVSWYGGEFGYPIVADDWVCTTTNPVTDIHWWGSFIGWTEAVPPPMPDEFRISFWTDVPSSPGQPGSFSHPGTNLWMVVCTNYTWQFAGYDLDPRDPAAGLETCFKFEQDLATNEWFFQDPLEGTNIYWVSIAAVYYNPTVVYPWGWKTRPRDLESPAPDDAVRIYDPTAPLPGMHWVSGVPIYWPEPTNSWDMAFQLTTRWPDDLDFGDAPDPTYPTVLTNNGARHYIVPGFNLGLQVDAETNGQPDSVATGDDTNNVADEDGVAFVPPVLVGTQAWVNVVLNPLYAGTGQLDAWLDFNANGAWEGTEKIFNSLTLASGVNNLSFTVPSNACVGPTFARFRLSSAGGLLPAGAAADGEVEDHAVTLWQRRPATNYIAITNLVLTTSNATIWWTAQTNVHYRLLAVHELRGMTINWTTVVTGAWSVVGSEVIGPANSQVETNRWSNSNRLYRVVAPFLWP